MNKHPAVLNYFPAPSGPSSKLQRVFYRRMIYLYGLTYRYWFWPVNPLCGWGPTHPKAFSQPGLHHHSCARAGSPCVREGEETTGCSLAFCDSFHIHFFFFSQTILVCWSSISLRQFIFPGHGGNEEAPVGAVKSLKYALCCWLIADTLIHGRKERPQVDSIKDMNLEIIKEHIRQTSRP